MQISYFNRKNTGLFTEISNRISYNQASLLPYITSPFSKEVFENQIELKSRHFTLFQRKILVEELSVSYNEIQTDQKVLDNIQALSNENTFTVTTGHQLSLFTGPIYFIYKILHTIKLTEELNLKYSENKFVPIFWMASEDHDFEEIKTVSLFNKTFNWNTDQKGAVGRFEIETLDTVVEEFKLLFANHPESEVVHLLNSYKGKTLGEASFNLINTLFKSYGLVIINGDNNEFKKEFSPLMEKELNTQFSFKAVTNSSQKLQEEGIKLQINPREINLFYLDENFRGRIQKHEDGFFIEGKGVFTKDELLTKLKNDPSSFSPNVVLRPLYQETILPNLCYLGGGGEMSYWLQLKEVFNQADCPYPLIQVRNSLLLIDPSTRKKMEKISLSINQLFQETDELKKQFIIANSKKELNFLNLDLSFEQLSKTIFNQAIQIDSNLENFAQAEITRIEKQLLVFKQKLIKSEKVKYEQILLQIEQLKNRLFPNGRMQERFINFFSLCSDGQVKSHIDEIYSAITAFGNDLIVIE